MRPRVLVADDHPVMLQTLSVLLTEEGEVVGLAADGQAAIEEARRHQPDVLVLDISDAGNEWVRRRSRNQG